MAKTTSGTASWGISSGSTVSSVTGVVTNIDINEEMMAEPQRNEVGAVCQMTQYDARTEVMADVEVAAEVDPPKSGSAITIAGVQGYVVRARVTESNSIYRKISVTAEMYPNCKAVTVA